MNYKPLILEKLKEMMVKNPDFSMGEVMYSILRKQALTSKPKEAKTAWLIDVKDKDLYSAIENAIENEIE